MERQKRKYIPLIIASVILLCSIALLYRAIEQTFSYKRAEATILSVSTEERVGGTSDDHYYYTESELKCSYTVNGLEYRKTFTIKADYSGQEGKTITILYNKASPYDSVLEMKSEKGFLYSVVFTAGCIYFIVFDIRKWSKIRKQENESILQASFSDFDIQQYEAVRKKQKRIDIILIIVSALLLLPLSALEIPLIVYTIARVADHRACNSLLSYYH